MRPALWHRNSIATSAIVPVGVATAAAPILYNFTNTADSWTAQGATLTNGATALTVNSTSTDPIIRRTVSFSGSLYPYIEISIFRTSGTLWDGKVFYSTGGHGESASFYMQITEPTWDGVNYQTILVDMRVLTNGSSDWTNNTITNVRLDFGLTATDDFLIEYIQFRGTIYPTAGLFQYSLAGYHNDDVNYLDAGSGAATVGALNSIVDNAVPENVSYAYLGYFLAPTTGRYKFSLASDDRSWMWIGDDAIAGNYTVNDSITSTTYNTGTVLSRNISMTAGVYYPVRIVYGNGVSAGFGINLSFTGPSIASRTDGTGYYFYNSDTTGI